jgi:hypothetical protein
VRLQRVEGTYLSSSGCERRILLALGMGKRAQLLPGYVIRSYVYASSSPITSSAPNTQHPTPNTFYNRILYRVAS